ncbi:DUF937 domain-containing protein [Mycolicibacterium diernhoferi]|uniref:DUF937 domain-containing protein n=1 Tax=Mycolicibacterium diernhoferi TaxID=1801 RepID=A0A1Q4HL98_9MYCO|nr:DUF937 domain-containing protein [Mycolicibacterium diernhoferi]OJZ68297.1 hypothetical protein BRW64_01570 [Mycolicibacterium diernhoferi]OPE54837.1 hypothetical protein BV510_08215 [Mycolicibacterium diernhoferi]PEG56142.1 DUF937 domain-containing protein [Mycolicibacterium diernhoferi]QYL21199.1 DUF937 domain-containing protein [Mycolicibacterium diernhoferi]
MAGLDELFAQIPVQDIATKLGADEGEVNNAIHTLVPALVGGLQVNVAADDIDSTDLEAEVGSQAASGLLDGGVTVDDVDPGQGDKIVATIFGGNDSTSVAAALAGTGAGSGDLIQKLLPILAPIVLAYIGKQFGAGAAAQPQAAPSGGGGLGDVLGSILGGAGGGGNNPLGSILGSVLGGGQGNNQGNVIGDILGGLLGGKK